MWGEELVLITPRRFARIRAPRDFGHVTLIAFANGCDYRRPLEAWLGAGHLTHERVPGFGSYHAIVACVASGAGIAIVPRSVVRVSRAEDNVAIPALPPAVARARTLLVRRRGHRSIALDALRATLRRADAARVRRASAEPGVRRQRRAG